MGGVGRLFYLLEEGECKGVDADNSEPYVQVGRDGEILCLDNGGDKRWKEDGDY